MFRLWKFLFNWNYIAWSNSADEGIARVHAGGDGVAYYYRYKTTQVIVRIEKPTDVIWLTCDSSEYFNTGSE